MRSWQSGRARALARYRRGTPREQRETSAGLQESRTLVAGDGHPSHRAIGFRLALNPHNVNRLIPLRKFDHLDGFPLRQLPQRLAVIDGTTICDDRFLDADPRLAARLQEGRALVTI